MRHDSNDKIFDLLLAEALMDVWDAELTELWGDEEYKEHKFSDEFERKIRKIKNSIGRKDRIKKGTQICTRFVITVAAIMGVLFGGLLTQPSVYAAVQNVIRTVFEKYDRYEYSGSDVTVENFNGNIRLGYVPDGYYLSSGDYSLASVSLTYVNKNKNKILFDYGIADGTSSIYDNEHNLYSDFTINGIEYRYYESNDSDFYDILLWYKDGYSFSVFAHLSKEELVKIAENVK